MWKVCLFFSQNNKIVLLLNMKDTFWQIHEVRKGSFPWFWLAGQANFDRMATTALMCCVWGGGGGGVVVLFSVQIGWVCQWDLLELAVVSCKQDITQRS